MNIDFLAFIVLHLSSQPKSAKKDQLFCRTTPAAENMNLEKVVEVEGERIIDWDQLIRRDGMVWYRREFDPSREL